MNNERIYDTLFQSNICSLNKKQKALIIGGLLGDLHIQKTSAATGKCRLRFCHSLKQKDYVDWKYKIFKQNFCEKTKPPFVDRTDYIFYTEYRNEFIETHSMWYTLKQDTNLFNKKRFVKKIPLNLGEIFTDSLALAVWYLDDGTKRNNVESCRIATQSFSKEENLLIQDCIKTNFDFDVKIESWGRTKDGEIAYSLAILSQGKNYKKFYDLIYDVVKTEIPSMLYKL